MNLPEFAIRRSVFAFMISAFLIIFGIIAYYKIGIQEIPNINYPVITVSTVLPGANPVLIDQTVSKPIEAQLNTVSGIKQINTTSTESRSSIELQFILGTDMNTAFSDIQSKLNQISNQLPSSTMPPLISKVQTGAEPIMLLALYGSQTNLELDKLARNTIKPALENIPGVGQVQILGSGKPVVHINLKLAEMAALKLGPQDIKNALSNQHLQEPGGYIDSQNKQYALNLNFEFQSLADLSNMVIAYRDRTPIYLKQIATLSFGTENSNQIAELNGLPTIGVSIIKKAQSNTVSITQLINQHIKNEIDGLLPRGIKLIPIYATATYIKTVVHTLEADIWLSILSAGFIIWIFLRNLRSTFIVVTAIPVSLFGVVIMMYFVGYTFNVVTLLGIILLVGIVVDDAIVVLENIYRHNETYNLNSIDAAISGSKEVLFAVLASSLTLICIFLPVIFMHNIVGLFFKSFAWVISVGVLISLFVSLTLTPMFCSRFIKFKKDKKDSLVIYKRIENGLNYIDKQYNKALKQVLESRYLVIIGALLLFLLSLLLLGRVGEAFMPQVSDNGYFYINVSTPQGSNQDYTLKRTKKIEAIIRQYPEIKYYFTDMSQANEANITVKLLPINQQTISQKKLMGLINSQIQNIPGIRSFVSSNGQSGSVTFSVLGPNFKNTIQAGGLLYSTLQKYPALGSTYVDMSFNQPEYVAVLNRSLANSLGVTARDVADTLSVVGQGAKIGKFTTQDGNQEDIILRVMPGEFNSANNISKIYLPSHQSNESIRLDTIGKLYSSLAPVSITRLNMNYSMNFSSNPIISLSNATKLIEQIGKKILPQGYIIKLTGNTASMQSTIKSVLNTFFLIILLIYMVLASQFNSFIQPFIILVAQPLALIGGILMLWITGQTLNIYSMIGLLLLMGLVAKNSILLIDLTNQFRRQGKTIKEALLTASPLRMRPVLMTSLTIIFAMLPSALSMAPGAAAHRALSLVIIGGMISSTILTLLVVPALYSIVENTLLRLRTRDKV